MNLIIWPLSFFQELRINSQQFGLRYQIMIHVYSTHVKNQMYTYIVRRVGDAHRQRISTPNLSECKSVKSFVLNDLNKLMAQKYERLSILYFWRTTLYRPCTMSSIASKTLYHQIIDPVQFIHKEIHFAMRNGSMPFRRRSFNPEILIGAFREGIKEIIFLNAFLFIQSKSTIEYTVLLMHHLRYRFTLDNCREVVQMTIYPSFVRV